MNGAIASFGDCPIAQITPDGTLPNNSRVRSQDNIRTLEGGTQAGGNLFHSFGEFSVPTGSEAYFNNVEDIQNIISRVTGGSVSSIDGLIRANGNANLFLINPNGIVFGANASLNVGGSFVASTANALQFGNIGIFSATDKNIPSPLLTINPSALLFNQINQNAAIQNNSVEPTGIDPAGFNTFGLRVPDGKSLLLVGGNVTMDGGRLNASGGRVELGGLAEPGIVALGVHGDNLSLIFPENLARASVSLTNQAGVFVNGPGGGNIAITTSNLEILKGSFLSGGIGQGLGTPQTVAGDITLNATGEIKVAGTGSVVANLVRLGSQGNGGNITIDSGSFSLRDGAVLTASTFGQGNAGNVAVRALDAVDLADGNIFSTVEAGGVGKGGNIDIKAATLSLIDGAQLSTITRGASDTQPAGQGDAGNVNVNVTGAVDIAGQKNGSFSLISSSVQTGTVGNGGNITIDSGSFSLRDGAVLTASTFGQGNAGNVTVQALDAVNLAGNAAIFSTVGAGGVGKGGNINIKAATLSLIDGAQLATITRGASDTQPAGQGDAGNVNVNVTGAVDIAGQKNGLPSGILSFVQTGTVGNGGNITIDSGSFSLRDGAVLTASTFGQGNAGTIKVNAAANVTISGRSSNLNSGLFVNSRSTTGTAGDIIVTSPRVTLDNSGTLNAQSASGNGGDINVQTDLLLLRRGAQISTTAGRVRAGGNGGNINIDAPSGFIVAVPKENSDITANAFTGSGGRVQINAFGIFGITPRSREDLARLLGTQDPTQLDPRLLPTSDITAISQTNPSLNGQVAIITPDVDPSRGLAELPTVPIETEVAQGCSPGGSQAQSQFIITGRGGLPPNPGEALSTDAVQVDLVTLNPRIKNRSIPNISTNPTRSTPVPLVEAQGWVRGANGKVVLTANAPTVTPHRSWQRPPECSALQSNPKL
ncbi:filamentous hemagglutinin N-terminal domain-containing protein [Cyanobacteria bacterium FACHB-472]|nr:filamentous hemagglutinin N-terminal domain-containing protein [Cyanobacteria bacterium FACHB-472]